MKDELTITLNRVGKQFYRSWLFRGITTSMDAGEQIALIGTNGSGKSTLMRVIAGQMSPSEGKVNYIKKGTIIPAVDRYRYIAWAAPYLSVFPELTFPEHFRLQNRFSSPLVSAADALELLQLQSHRLKPLRYYSSGMLQRAKVGLALFQQSDILLLDEPTSNMDDHFSSMILALIRTYAQDRTLILASNLEREYGEIVRQIHLGERIAS